MEQKDHDLLISLNTKMITFYDSLTEVKRDIKSIKERPFPCHEQSEKCSIKFDNLDKRLDRRSKWSQLVTVLIILLTVLSAIIGYNFKLDARQTDRIDKLKETVIVNSENLRHR